MVSANLEFQATLPVGTPETIEPYVQITPHGSTMPISGAFSWKSIDATTYQLTFLPTALTDLTDYVISVTDPRAVPFKTGISTGSRPRVVGATLHADGGASAVYCEATFSEPMDPVSIATDLQVTAGGSAVVGTVSAVSTTALANTTFHFAVALPHNLATPIVVVVKAGATAAAGGKLIPQSWDSPTAPTGATGDFNWSVTPTPPLDQQSTGVTYSFSPTIN
jgi:hypothetical protein